MFPRAGNPTHIPRTYGHNTVQVDELNRAAKEFKLNASCDGLWWHLQRQNHWCHGFQSMQLQCNMLTLGSVKGLGCLISCLWCRSTKTRQLHSQWLFFQHLLRNRADKRPLGNQFHAVMPHWFKHCRTRRSSGKPNYLLVALDRKP